MKKVNFLYLMLLVVAFSACNSDDDDNYWGDWANSDFFTGNFRTLAVSFQSKDGKDVYVGMGFNDDLKNTTDKYLNDFYKFNGTEWSPVVERFPGAGRQGCVAFALGDTAYVGAGYRAKGSGSTLKNTFYSDFFLFDMKSEKWMKDASGEYLKTDIAGGDGVDSVACKFWGGIGFELDGKGYVGTGNIEGRVSKDMYRYCPRTEKWEHVSMSGDPRAGAVVFKIGETAVICLGTDGSKNNVGVLTFDGTTWSAKAPLVGSLDGEWNDDYDEIPRHYAVAFTSNKDYGDCGYIAGGMSNTVWRYSLAEDRWHEVEHFPIAMAQRSGAVGFSINQIGYITTGGSSLGFANNNTTWQFDPGEKEDENDDYSSSTSDK